MSPLTSWWSLTSCHLPFIFTLYELHLQWWVMQQASWKTARHALHLKWCKAVKEILSSRAHGCSLIHKLKRVSIRLLWLDSQRFAFLNEMPLQGGRWKSFLKKWPENANWEMMNYILIRVCLELLLCFCQIASCILFFLTSKMLIIMVAATCQMSLSEQRPKP